MRVSCAVRLVSATFAAVACLGGAAVPTASALEGQPLEITKFTLQTTRAVKTPISHTSYGFVNEPVPFTQAGGHLTGQDGGAEGLTSTIEFATEEITTPTRGTAFVPTRDPRNIAVTIPPGLLGNPTAVPRCPLKEALTVGSPCPAATQIGVAVFHIFAGLEYAGPIVNVTPEAGQSAEFAIETTSKVNFLLTAHVARTPEGYGLTVVSQGTPNVQLVNSELTFWGVPAAETHTPQRDLFCERLYDRGALWECGYPTFKNHIIAGLGGEKSTEPEVPFVTMPADCSAGPLTATVKADSWEEPVRYEGGRTIEGQYAEKSTTLPGATGCNLLQFAPGIEVKPSTSLAEAPVGLGVNLTVPQFEEPERPATPELRAAVVTLPPGMSVSPGVVDGIEACNESGPEGIDLTGPESEEIGLDGEPQLAAGHCPSASTVGTAKAFTPLLNEPVEGHVYLAKPGCGGPGDECTEQDALDGNLYKLYLELGGTGRLANAGVHLKIPGYVEANPATGQLTTRFEGFAVGNPPVFQGNPQFPFSKLEVHLNDGPRASIDNPATCGVARTTSELTPWSAPGTTPEGAFTAGLPDVTPSSFFEVEGCADPPGLAPGFTAGTVTPNAGRFSSFTLNISRKDREQLLSGVQLHTPPGLLGMLSSVPLCGEPQAQQGTCSPASQIGTTRVASGAGSHPFEIEGAVYLTTGYKGAPFGLSIVTKAVAGPFNLGLVVVRAQIDVNPETAALTVTSDPLPQILFGVPLRLQRITVDIDRPNFMFNPTSCRAQQIVADISGVQQALAEVSTPFAVGGCASLAFKPTFKATTSAHTSRADGASLDVKLSYPAGSVGTEANIAKVKVDLPKQLPSRLSTLQKACTAATFARNPAACSAASIVGIVRASTPLLPVGLSGPVYFVSHGGEAFPSLIVVLQGDGVRVDLTGTTFISKAGITSSTFGAVPDVPVNTFELYLPEGKYSALAANGNLCQQASKLVMPTEFVAQNGAIIKQSTKIAVSGCKAGKVKTGKVKVGNVTGRTAK